MIVGHAGVAFAITLPTALLDKPSGQAHKTTRTGSVTLIQCFGGALNLTIHFHMLFLDGVYLDGVKGPPRLRWVKAPTSDELTQLVHAIARRIGHFLEHPGLLEWDAEISYLVSDTEPATRMTQSLLRRAKWPVSSLHAGVASNAHGRISRDFTAILMAAWLLIVCELLKGLGEKGVYSSYYTRRDLSHGVSLTVCAADIQLKLTDVCGTEPAE
jgi:Putative transposase